MSSLESLATLNQLMKRAPSKRVRRERNQQNIGLFIRRVSDKSGKQPARVAKTSAATPEKPRMTEKEARAKKNAATLHAAGRLQTKKSMEIQEQVLELMRAQKEHRKPNIQKKHKLSFYDFEDYED
ncbi:hypothetical protein GGI15_004939 [Coemansia interrupta]|uniref:Uncharacterized protein n=1 Tax=Coemansia interrupta TaxID=1126814 RepID=A0A9W8H200_9FUNG|nr:hypothetical protein GGI15_004939 [Coemansia interrupta]